VYVGRVPRACRRESARTRLEPVSPPESVAGRALRTQGLSV